jgi:hypothetical protein
VLTQVLQTAKSGNTLTLGTPTLNTLIQNALTVAGILSLSSQLQINSDVLFSNASSNFTVVNGVTAGVATFYQPFRGQPFNVVLVVYAGFQNNGVSAQNIVLPTAFQNGAKIWAGGQPALQLLSNSVAQSISVITALASTGGTTTAVTTLNSNSIGECNHFFDTISMVGSQTSTHTGILLLVGS